MGICVGERGMCGGLLLWLGKGSGLGSWEMPQKETSDPLTALCILNNSQSQVSGESQGKGETGGKNADTEEK